MSPLNFLALLAGLSLAGAARFSPVYVWAPNRLGYDWTGTKRVSFDEKVYPLYMAAHGHRLFLSLSKLSDTPASLVWLPNNSSAPPQLAAYPSWETHKTSACSGIHKAKGIEVDTKGRLWVLDEGSDSCRAKLLIFDLATDSVELVHNFPETVVLPSRHSRDLLDIVLDETQDDWLAYISESRREHLVVFSLKKNQSWSVKTPGKQWLSLALTPKGEQRRLFLGQFDAKDLYSTSVASLRADPPTATPELVGNFSERPYRTLVDAASVVHTAFLSASHVSIWNVTGPLPGRRVFDARDLGATYPFTFAIDEAGTFWMTEKNSAVWSKQKFRLLKAELGVKSYLYPAEATNSSP